jgi:hypothetical protein
MITSRSPGELYGLSDLFLFFLRAPLTNGHCNSARRESGRKTGMADIGTVPSVDETAAIPDGLTREEDDELRRLHWFAQIGTLAARRVERLIELRLRDRRKEVRPPREFEEKATPPAFPETAMSQFDGCISKSAEVPVDMNDLAEVRRLLEHMAKSRLKLPFDEDEHHRYRELLEAERALLASRKNLDH